MTGYLSRSHVNAGREQRELAHCVEAKETVYRLPWCHVDGPEFAHMDGGVIDRLNLNREVARLAIG
jgi:hypothetical protein